MFIATERRRHLRRSRLALFCVGTILGSGIAFPVLAQSSDGIPVAPVQSSPDNYGVDLATGALNLSISDISAGDATSGIVHKRHWVGLNQWRDQFDITLSETSGKVIVGVGGASESFTKTANGYIFDQGNGSTLTLQDSLYTHTAKDGTVTTFGHYDARDGYRATQVSRPDGEKLTFTYTTSFYWIQNNTEQVDISRPESVESSSGYRLTFSYVTDGVSDAKSAKAWTTRAGVSIENVNRASGVIASSIYNQPTYVGARTLKVSDMGGRTTAYDIDASGRIISMTYPGSTSTDVSIAYNSVGRISSVTDTSGTTSYTYSDNGGIRTTVVTDPNGGASNYTFNIATQKMLSSTNAVGKTTSFQYDGYGRTQRVTYPEYNATQYTYDTRGNVTEVRSIAKPGSGIADSVISTSYPCTSVATCDKPQWTRDARNNQTDYTYDPTTGVVLSVTAPPDTAGLRATTNYTYTSINGVKRPDSIVTCRTAASCANTANELVLSFGYDVNGLPSSVTQRAGNNSVVSTTTMAYDLFGNKMSVDGPLPGVRDASYYRFGPARQLIGQVMPDPDGTGPLVRSAMRTTYDARDRAVLVEQGTVTDISNNAWNAFTTAQSVERRFDGANRLLKEIIRGNGSAYSVKQNSFIGQRLDCSAIRLNGAVWGSLPASACTAQGAGTAGPDRITKFDYDAAGRVTKKTAGYGTADAAGESTSYTANGKTATVTDANGNVTAYTYDGADRTFRTCFQTTSSAACAGSPGNYEQLSYDAAGNVMTRQLRDGQIVSYSYDALNRLTSKGQIVSGATQINQNYGYDLFNNLTSASAGTRVLGFVYDALSRKTTQSDNTYTFGNASFLYDAAGQRTRFTFADGIFVTYDYLSNGALSVIRDGNGAALATFGYDDLGRRRSLTRSNGTVTTYDYDFASRLSQLVQDLGGSTYDLTMKFTYNTASQISGRTLSNNNYAYAGRYNIDRPYSVNGLNQYTVAGGDTPGYDARGNLVSSTGKSYTYNIDNQMITASDITGSLIYDPLGRLSSGRVSPTTSPVTAFTYDGANLIAEINGGNNALLRRYVYGPGIDEPLIWYEGSGTGDRRWHHADERGSIIAISNDAGALMAVNRYDEFGIPSNLLGRFAYTGQKWIPSLGLYDYKARMYSPTLGRFMQTDPIGYGDGLNNYTYGANDPVNNSDPSGLASDIAYKDDAVVHGVIPWWQGLTFWERQMDARAALTNSGAINTEKGGNDQSGPDVVVTGRRRAKAPQGSNPATPKACASRLYRFGNGLKYAGKGVTYSGLTIAALGAPAGPVGSGPGVTIAGAGGAIGATGQLLQDLAFGSPKFEAFTRFTANLFGGRVLSSVVPPSVRSEVGDAFYEEAASTALSPVTGFLDPERGC